MMSAFFFMLRWEVARLLSGRDRVRRVALPGTFLVLVVLVQGAILPSAATRSPWWFVVLAALPLFIVLALAADSFAGERERGTLETLLLSPVPDAAIVGGKIAALLLYTALSLGTLLGVHAISQWGVARTTPSPLTYGLVFGLGLAVYTTAISWSTLWSWLAPTVQVAQQALIYPLATLAVAGAYVPTAWPRLLRFVNQYAMPSPARLAGLGLGVATLIAGASLLLVIARFRRDRLLLRC